MYLEHAWLPIRTIANLEARIQYLIFIKTKCIHEYH